MIRILHNAERRRPILTCDVCERQITNARLAAALFNSNSTDLNNGDLQNVVYVHKGRCFDTAESRMMELGVQPGWNELTRHLSRLLHSVGLTADQVEPPDENDQQAAEQVVAADRLQPCARSSLRAFGGG